MTGFQSCSRGRGQQRRNEHIPRVDRSTESNEEEGEEHNKGSDESVHCKLSFLVGRRRRIETQTESWWTGEGKVESKSAAFIAS